MKCLYMALGLFLARLASRCHPVASSESCSGDMQASSVWEVTAGYIGALTAEVPFTNLYSESVVLTIDELLLTVRPRAISATTSNHC